MSVICPSLLCLPDQLPSRGPAWGRAGPASTLTLRPSQCASQAHVPPDPHFIRTELLSPGGKGKPLGVGWAWPGGPPNHRLPSAQSCHGAPTRWVPQGGFPGPHQGGRQPSARPKVPPSVCPLQLAAPTCQRPPHTAPQLPPFLPASESPLRARTALPTPGRGCTDSPRASSRALRERRWLCTPNLCWACPLELNAGLGLPGCQAGLGASPSIPSELGPCRAPLGQGPVRHVPAGPQHQPAPQTPNEAADAPHEDPTLGGAGAPGLKLPAPHARALTHADTHIHTLGAAEPTQAVPTGVLRGGSPGSGLQRQLPANPPAHPSPCAGPRSRVGGPALNPGTTQWGLCL